jgi:hypothetical protein
MTDPFPYSEYSELPIMFLARTFAQTLVPHGRSYGLDVSTEIGIVQVLVLITVREVPSQ